MQYGTNLKGNFYSQERSVHHKREDGTECIYVKTVPYKQGPIRQSNKSIQQGIKAQRRRTLDNKTNIKKTVGINGASQAIQFPTNEKLEDGRHRYFIKYGVAVDRLTNI